MGQVCSHLCAAGMPCWFGDKPLHCCRTLCSSQRSPCRLSTPRLHSLYVLCQSTSHPPSIYPRSLSYINECIKRARRDIGQLQLRKAALEQATRWRPNVRRT